MNHLTHPLISANISIFSPEISKSCYIKNTDIDCIWYIIFNSFNFSWVFKDCLNKHARNFDDVTEIGYASLLKIKVFWNKIYDVIISVHGVTNKILLHDSNHFACYQSLVTPVFLWDKLSWHQFHKDLTRKTVFEGWSWFKFSNLGLPLGTGLKFYTSVAKD